MRAPASARAPRSTYLGMRLADGRRGLDGGRQHQPRGRPGRLPRHAAAAGGRLRRDRERRHGRARRTSACRSPTRTAECCSRSRRRRRATSTIPRATCRRSATGCTPPRSEPSGTSFDVFGSFPQARLRQDRHRPARTERDQSWYVAYVPDPSGRSSSRHGRVRRLRRRGGGAGRAADPVAVVRHQKRDHRRELATTLMSATPDPAAQRRRDHEPRGPRMLLLDPWLLLADARAGRLLARRHQGRDARRRRRARRCTSSSASSATRSSGSC